jgi:hypothetical protein
MGRVGKRQPCPPAGSCSAEQRTAPESKGDPDRFPLQPWSEKGGDEQSQRRPGEQGTTQRQLSPAAQNPTRVPERAGFCHAQLTATLFAALTARSGGFSCRLLPSSDGRSQSGSD